MGYTTRTLDGTIKRVKYDYSYLRLKGGKTEIKSQVAVSGQLCQQAVKELKEFGQELLNDSIPEPSWEDISEGVNFIPPTAFGEVLTMGLSAIGHADRKIAQWKIIRAAHEKHLPLLLPQIDERIREAKDMRQKLLDDEIALEANRRIVNQEKRDKKVEDRISVLEEALHTSKFPPEAKNIQAAINGYRNGDIEYSTQYTLIWSGQIVDRANTYAEFTADRITRLDRYFESYGPGWLWWESPLNVHPNNAPRQSRCCDLVRNVAYHGLGQYYLIQSYWKRADWVRRLPVSKWTMQPPPEIAANFLTSDDGRVYCQSEGPKLAYTSLLDSGATYPSLYPRDFHDLGIDPDNYAAQTIEQLGTANGTVNSRTFEMFVTVIHQETLQSLVDENDAVWPYHGKYLGGLCPVSTIMDTTEDPDPEGFIPNLRLSGLLPFLACYLTSTPTRNKFFLGEDRNDVMGGHKTPGHRRWDISMPSTQTAPNSMWDRYDNPKIRFSHREGMLVNQDRDDIKHASTTTVLPGFAMQTVLHHNPRADCDEAMARKQAEAVAIAPPAINTV